MNETTNTLKESEDLWELTHEFGTIMTDFMQKHAVNMMDAFFLLTALMGIAAARVGMDKEETGEMVKSLLMKTMEGAGSVDGEDK